MNNIITIKDIVKNEICVGCGSCISESKSSKMIWNKEGFLVPDITSEFSDKAIDLCPFNPKPDSCVANEDVLAEEFISDYKNADNQIGRYTNTYVGYSPEFRLTSSSGGMATYLFKQLLQQKIVDYLFVVKEIGSTYEYQLFNNVDEIKLISKTRYIPVTLENLYRKIDGINGKIAISGVACFIKAIRLKQHYCPELKDKIPFLIGIICGGLKSRSFSDYLSLKSGIKGNYYDAEYRIKDEESTASDYSFGAFDDDRNFHKMKMKTVGDMWGTGLFKSNACDFCDDVTTELADISLGDAWLAPYNSDGLGTNVIVTRSLLADKLIRNGIDKGELYLEQLDIERFKSSQQGSFNHRHDGLKYRIDIKTKENRLTPSCRKRFLVNIPFYFKLVQKERMNLRAQSLELWSVTKNAKDFENRINPLKDKLAKTTLIYHRIRKMKRILRRYL